jgi:hypothetical protein
MSRKRDFGHAWISLWERILGSDTPDTFLRNGVAVKGAVYNAWLERFIGQRDRGIADFLTFYLDDITADAKGVKRCPECGTEKGNHAPYCRVAATESRMTTFETIMRIGLQNDRASAVLAATLSVAAYEPNPASAVDRVLREAPLENSVAYAATVMRSRLLRVELANMLLAQPSLIPNQSGDEALHELNGLLSCLVTSQPGRYARTGAACDAPWVYLVDEFEKLAALGKTERASMSQTCALVREMGMLTTTTQELLTIEP